MPNSLYFKKPSSTSTTRTRKVNLGSCRKVVCLTGQTAMFHQSISSVQTITGSATTKSVTVKLVTPEIATSGVRNIKTSYHNVVKAVAPNGDKVSGKVTSIVPIKNLDNEIVHFELTARLSLDTAQVGTYEMMWEFLAIVDNFLHLVEVPQTYNFNGQNI